MSAVTASRPATFPLLRHRVTTILLDHLGTQADKASGCPWCYYAPGPVCGQHAEVQDRLGAAAVMAAKAQDRLGVLMALAHARGASR